jgi:tetratricopeptide (TPR) repeat protein
VNAEGIYPGGYYPHNIHFLLVSAQMAGDGPTVVAAAEKLQATVTDEAVRTIPWVQPIKAAPYFAHAQFSAPDTVLALAAPTDEFPYIRAMWHYARGVAHAAKGQFAEARSEAEAIAALGEQADFAQLAAAGVPAPDLLRIARHVVLGRIAQAQGDLATGIREFEAAAALEDKLPYMEPPFWYYPVRQSLGALRLLAGQADRAETEFRASLKGAPNNGWALYGLMEVHKARGETEQANDMARRLRQAWAGDHGLLDLARL